MHAHNWIIATNETENSLAEGKKKLIDLFEKKNSINIILVVNEPLGIYKRI